MKLRSLLSGSLFLLGIVPVSIAVFANVPLVVEQLKSFYHQTHIQTLRGQFRDLDQHLASRQQVATLLTRLPEPGSMIFDDDQAPSVLDQARLNYSSWVSRLFNDYPDLLEISYYNNQAVPRFWLSRSNVTGMLEPTITPITRPPEALLAKVFSAPPNTIFISPIRLNFEQPDSRHYMTMRLASLIVDNQGASIGAVVITIDVGGMARISPDTFWVGEKGNYLMPDVKRQNNNSAFDDFAGLSKIFANKKLSLWAKKGREIFWIPMFKTESSGLLWVGRYVDPSPLNDFLSDIFWRIIWGMLVLVVVIWLGVNSIAKRLTGFSDSLKLSLKQVLDGETNVRFFWRGTTEIRQLGQDMTSLAKKHSHNIRELKQRTEQLEAGNRYKSEFLANASHELKTPLNSILLLSKILNEKKLNVSSEDQQQLQVLHKASVDLKRLVDNILDLSRIEAGKLEMMSERVMLADLLRDIVTIVQPQFDEKGVDLILDIRCSKNSVVETDPEKVAQIIKNFLSNALKFTAKGNVQLVLSQNSGTEKHHYPVVISVKDSGIGIPEDKQQHIFEVFTQADGSTHRHYGGSGLGLTISQSLAQLIGGIIMLQSEIGKGATFSLLLPVSAQDSSYIDTTGMVLQKSKDIVETNRKDWSLHTGILLVYFDINDLLDLTPLMENSGMVVHAADDQEESLDVLHEDQDLSIVIVDGRKSPKDACDTIQAINHVNHEIDCVVLHQQNQDIQCDIENLRLFEDGSGKKQALVELVETILSKE